MKISHIFHFYVTVLKMDPGGYNSSSEDEFLRDVMEFLSRERRRRTRQNPMVTKPSGLNSASAEFKKKYRFSKPVVESTLEFICPAHENPDGKNNPLTPMIQLLIALRFYATGTMQNLVADYMDVATSPVCRTIQRVTAAIANLPPQIIKMPESAEEIAQVQQIFYQIAEFPRVVGCIDYPYTDFIAWW